jgi:hypothetical protein
LSPDVFFELVEVVVHNGDFTAFQTLAEKGAAVQKTGLPQERADFIIQVMHVAYPPLFISTGFLGGGGKSVAFIKESLDMWDHLDMSQGKPAVGPITGLDPFGFGYVPLGLPVADLLLCGTGQLGCVTDAEILNAIGCHLKSSF